MSTPHPSHVRKLTRVGVCIELLFDVDRPGKFVQAVTSLPGREGAMTKTWPLDRMGTMDFPAYRDLVTYIDSVIFDCISLNGGIQDRLPM